ncbi:unnamed protein product [Rotaria socialis]|uniref:Phosphatidylinositol-specific phospholipase C X domain-containing protein n=1 Tax=Rotaria socialis TaxID=392032 RepID=A0A817TBK0_9BILA|nr:unnamed protein product [Rotaria socialis]CAF4488577.1 unnamed protein product [Rotaria socialis]
MAVTCCRSNIVSTIPHGKHIEWMTNLPTSLHNESVSKLAIPGSHNSFAYNLTRSGGPDLSQGLKRFLPVIGFFIKRWSVTQKETFTEQLQTGIRYFDLRVCNVVSEASNQTPQFKFTHGLLGGLVGECLQEINRFLDEHSKEIVLLDFNHFYEFNDQFGHDQLLQLIHEIFGKKLCTTARTISECTLNYLWTNQQQVILLYEENADKCTAYMDRVGHFFKICQSPWPNTPQIDNLFQFLDENVASPRSTDCINVIQGQITPDDKSITNHPFSSLHSTSQETNRRLIPWITCRHRDPSLVNGVNVVMCDFVDSVFADSVIMLNYKTAGPTTAVNL